MEKSLIEKLEESKRSIETVGADSWYITLTKKEIDYLLKKDDDIKRIAIGFYKYKLHNMVTEETSQFIKELYTEYLNTLPTK